MKCKRSSAYYPSLAILILLLVACAGASEPEYEPAEAPAESEEFPFEPTFVPKAQTQKEEEERAPSPETLVTATQQLPKEEPITSPTSVPDMPAPRQVPEARLLSFEWPSEMREGDSDILRLSFVVDEGGRITPTAVFADHQIESQAIEIENLYDTHLVRAEARLDLAGPQVLPSGTQIKRMFPGEPVEFTWSVKPTSTGTFRGNVWLYLRFIPKEAGEELERLVYSNPIEIRTVNLLGLGGTPARIFGAIGSAIGSLLGLDDIISLIRRRRNNPTSKFLEDE
jgi:hypothetical protein